METFFSNAFKISILLNPFAVLSTFIALTGKMSVRKKKNIMLRTGFAAFIAGCVVLFSGSMLLTLMGVDLDLFKVGGGVVLMICSITLVWGREKQSESADPGDLSIAVVPLAVPMAVGPGTAAGLIIIGSEGVTCPWSYILNTGALLAGILVLAAVLALGVWSNKLLSRTTVSVITRLTGLFLSALAAKMILEGIRNYLGLVRG